MPGSSDEVKYSSEDFERLKSVLQLKGGVEIRIVSESMVPLLPVGAIAELVPCGYDDLRRYDLVVFWYQGRLVCHCVWDHGHFKSANGERTLITRGLANAGSDDPVHESWILGRVVSHAVTPAQFNWNYLKAKLKSRMFRGRT